MAVSASSTTDFTTAVYSGTAVTLTGGGFCLSWS